MVGPIKQRRSGRVGRRGGAPRYSAREWAIRGTLGLLIAIVGYTSVTFSTAQVVAKSTPALAHALSPGNGRITAAYAMELAQPQATPAELARADDLARLALRQDPTAVNAVATLGFDAAVRGDTAGARRSFAYAQQLSRRDIKTQLWSIEDAVARGNIPEALRWYDAALRTNAALTDVLFPILVKASESAAIRTELVRKLAGGTPWTEAFVKFAAGNGQKPEVTATLFEALRRARVAIPASADAGLIDALARRANYDQAWAYYASVRPGSDRRRSRDPRFAAELEQPTQFDWIAVNTNDISTSLREGGFHFEAPASAGGMVLWQKQLLPAGRYRLTGSSADIDQPDAARPYWTLTCQDGHEIGRYVIPNSNLAGGQFSTQFDVPPTCPVQILMFSARPTETGSGSSGSLNRAVLAPLP